VRTGGRGGGQPPSRRAARLSPCPGLTGTVSRAAPRLGATQDGKEPDPSEQCAAVAFQVIHVFGSWRSFF